MVQSGHYIITLDRSLVSHEATRGLGRTSGHSASDLNRIWNTR
jgi:hypothetical protein